MPQQPRPSPPRAPPVVPQAPVQGPPNPTRPPPGGQPPIAPGPPMPTRPPPSPEHPPIGPIFPSPPSPPILNPNVPTVPTASPNQRPATRPPRISLVGVPDARCPLHQNPRNPVHLPHHSNCERFFKCDHGLAFEYQCPIGQHWNAMRNFCDFPNMAGCGQNNFPNNNIPVWNSPPNNNMPVWNSPPSINIPVWNSPPTDPIFQNPIVIPMAPGK